MKITLERTDRIVLFNGVDARIWTGVTDKGVEVECYIVSIATRANELRDEEFQSELKKINTPVINEPISLRKL